MGDFALTSAAFQPGEPIPRRHTCEGEDLSPPLAWSSPPEGTRSLALILEDPDAPVGTFTHWLAWGIDADARGLAQGQAAPVEARNDFGTTGVPRALPAARARPARLCLSLVRTPVSLGAARRRRQGRRGARRSRPTLAVAELVGTYER